MSEMYIQNKLRIHAVEYKRCQRDWAKANKISDPARRKARRSRVTSLRNSVRAALVREIKRVEKEMNRESKY